MAAGNVPLVPEEISFDAAFTGRVVRRQLKASSTFRRAVKLAGATATDPCVAVELKKKTLPAVGRAVVQKLFDFLTPPPPAFEKHHLVFIFIKLFYCEKDMTVLST